jgi:hypothetical protein
LVVDVAEHFHLLVAMAGLAAAAEPAAELNPAAQVFILDLLLFLEQDKVITEVQ